jgi:hypothetical protein
MVLEAAADKPCPANTERKRRTKIFESFPSVNELIFCFIIICCLPDHADNPAEKSQGEEFDTFSNGGQWRHTMAFEKRFPAIRLFTGRLQPLQSSIGKNDYQFRLYHSNWADTIPPPILSSHIS